MHNISEIIQDAEQKISKQLNKKIWLRIFDNFYNEDVFKVWSAVCKALNVDEHEALTHNCRQHFLEARKLGMLYIKKLCFQSPNELAHFFNRSHCVITRGLKSIEGLIAVKDEKIMAKVALIEKELNKTV